MSKNAEERFYGKFSQTQVLQASINTCADFALGGRYHICDWSLRKDPLRNCCTIVELGCGGGDHLLYLKEKYAFKSGIGFDLGFSEECVSGECFFRKANLNNRWEIEDGTVDVLIAMMVIEHLFDPFFCFKEIQRVLSNDGRAFVNLPLVTSLKNRLRLLAGYIPTTSVPYSRWGIEGHWDGFHLHYFSLQSIYDLAYQADLEIMSIQGVGRFKSFKEIFPCLLCGEISFELRRKDFRRSLPTGGRWR